MEGVFASVRFCSFASNNSGKTVDNGKVTMVVAPIPAAPADGWSYRIHKTHQPYMVDCMKFVLGDNSLEKDTVFTKEQLLALTPQHIARWLTNRAYGKPDIDEDDRPISARSGSLQKAKGGVSHYHPNKHVPWMDAREGFQGSGNPTQHPTVSAVIARVRRHETRGEGVKTQVKREYTTEEFYKVLSILLSFSSFDFLKFLVMTLWSYHLIHRLNDTANFKLSAPHGNKNWPFTIMTKTKWSKNVRTERDCPDQIILGAQDSCLCILLWLALYLEEYLEQNPNATFMFTNTMMMRILPMITFWEQASLIKAII